jgi:hypothetical protein
MTALAVSLIVAACVFSGAMLATLAARALPDPHLNAEARDVIKVAMALVATLVALVLGLMIATAKGTYDAQSAGVRQLSADILLLDRMLAEYGTETKPARALLYRFANLGLHRLWPEDGSAPVSLAPTEALAEKHAFLREVTGLSPQNELQQILKARALQAMTDLAQARLQVYTNASSGLPLPFLVLVVFWLVILFAGYGLIAPRNATVIASLLACSLSVAGAVYLIEELANPFSGMVRVSSEPLREVIGQLGQ